MKSISRQELVSWLDATLTPASFNDYCPNGLQVEGNPSVSHIIAGVTASQDLIDRAISQGADTLLVHHGWFWKGEDPRVRGTRKNRLAALLKHDINLIAYHLPLDAHPVLGNNAQLASVLGLTPATPPTLAPTSQVWHGTMPGATTLEHISLRTEERLKRQPLVIGAPDMHVHRIAWCTGAAHSMLAEAIDAGAQAYITGEISEPAVHLAREAGIGLISAGHHATERYGAQALGAAIADRFGIRVDFVDIDNPV